MEIRPYSDLESLKRDLGKITRKVDTRRKEAQRIGNMLLVSKTFDCFNQKKTIVASKIWTLAQSELEELTTTRQELNNCLQHLHTNLKTQQGAKRAALQTQELLAACRQANMDLQFKMRTVLQHSVPKSYTSMVKATGNHLSRALEISDETVVARKGESSSRISQIYHCANVKDNNGFEHPHIYVILTANFINKKRIDYRLAIAHAFNPRNFPIGKLISKKELSKKLTQLLKQENIG